jgi:endonuclease YncB( thermonuclease family)
MFNRTVHVEYSKYDKYGRIIGKVSLKGQDICLEQITKGMAWHYKEYQKEQSLIDRDLYSSAELKVKDSKLGLWKDINTIPPWEFRKIKI